MHPRLIVCGWQVIPLVFGFPSRQLVANQSRGYLLLGGDNLADGEPHMKPCWVCRSCGIRYTRYPHAPSAAQNSDGGEGEVMLRGLISP
jgi:hypothetical protein